MQRTRFDHWLASAAVAAALTLVGAHTSWSQSAPAVEAGVPVPDTSLMPPPTAADIGAPEKREPAATTAPAPAVTAAPAPAATPAESKPAVTAAPAQPEPAAAPAQTAAPAAAPAPAPVVVSVDQAIADKLRGLSDGKFDKVLGRRDRPGVETFYSQRQFAPLWLTNGALNERGKAAIAYLGHVGVDGLDPADYATPDFKGLTEADALADAEIKLTDALLTYARHAQTGRIHYSRIAADIEYDQKRPNPADVLASLADGPIAAALDAMQPQHAGYKALKAKLAIAQGTTGDHAMPRIPNGPALRYAKDKKGKETIPSDPRVPLLRERLDVSGDKTSTAYDKDVAAAVSKLQKERGLPATGRLTDATVDAINGPRRDRDADVIIANMDRWRWMPRDLGDTYVMVNIPDYTLRVMKDGKQVWKTKIVVGKPTQATPIMTGEMKFITVNPTWNVPPSIIKNEYLPALAQDPTVLSRMGLKIAHNSDGTVRIWQPPGDRNALGRIRFNFPNKFLVYQHDTPDKNLFAHSRRAYSHGCMRVEDPLKYGEVLLSLVRPNDNYSAERLRKMFGGGEVNINFPKTLPVHLTYQTAFVDDAGKLQMREDIYGRDNRMIAQLKGSDRRLADTVMDRPRNTSAVPVRAARGSVPGASTTGSGDSRGFNGPSFFDRLFGGGYEETPAPSSRQRARSARSDRNAYR